MDVSSLLLSSLIKFAQRQAAEPIQHGDLYQFLREHRTISLGLPRRSGKTTAVLERAKLPSTVTVAKHRHAVKPLTQQGARIVLTMSDIQQQQLPVAAIQGQAGTIDLLIVDEGLGLNAEDDAHVMDFATRLWTCGVADRERFVVALIGT